jgi:folylpolyglutamate synthase/dihydropteroate synthase
MFCTQFVSRTCGPISGAELKDTVMHIAKEKLGIADEHVPANCHESNGLVERLNSYSCEHRACCTDEDTLACHIVG